MNEMEETLGFLEAAIFISPMEDIAPYKDKADAPQQQYVNNKGVLGKDQTGSGKCLLDDNCNALLKLIGRVCLLAPF